LAGAVFISARVRTTHRYFLGLYLPEQRPARAPGKHGPKVSGATRTAHSQHELENEMNKSLVALLGALIAAATMFAAPAEAGLKIHFGFGGFHSHGGGGHVHRHYKRKRYIVRRVARKKAYVAKKSTPAVSKVAKVEKKVSKPKVVAAVPVTEEAEVIADNENSSITTAAIEPVETSAVVEPEAADPVSAEAGGNTAKVEAKPDRTAGKLDCKKFFPSVGMTLSVRCE
jgi:hypothetical protein